MKAGVAVHAVGKAWRRRAFPVILLALPAAAAEPPSLRSAGNGDATVVALERLLDAAGESADAAGRAQQHLRLGDLYAARGRRRNAAAQYARSLDLNPEQPVLHYRAGILYRQLGENGQAVRHLGESWKRGFRNTGARYHLAAAQLAVGQLAAGLDHARAVLAAGSPGGGLELRVGLLLFRHLFYRDAAKAFETAFDRSGGALEPRMHLALTNHLLNLHDRTVELLSPLAAAGGSPNAEALTLLASALAALDRSGEAGDLFRRIIAEVPSSPHAYLNLALVLLEEGRVAAAETWLEGMLARAGGSSPKVFYQVRRNTCQEAQTELLVDPAGDLADRQGSADPYRAFATMLSGRHHYGTAVALLRVAARREGPPAQVDVALLDAVAFNCLNLEPASEVPVALLERSIELAPGRPRAHFLLGHAHRRLRRPASAAAAFERSIQLQPDSAAYCFALAQVLADGSADAARAAELLGRVIELAPEHASARFELGKLLLAQDRLEEAAEQLHRSLATEPEFHEAYYVLGQLHLRQGRHELAREFLRKFEARKAALDARSSVWKGVTVQPGTG